MMSYSLTRVWRFLPEQDVFSPDRVILETEWVWRFADTFKPKDICQGLRNGLGLSNIHVANASLIAQVIQWHEKGLDGS